MGFHNFKHILVNQFPHTPAISKRNLLHKYQWISAHITQCNTIQSTLDTVAKIQDKNIAEGIIHLIPAYHEMVEFENAQRKSLFDTTRIWEEKMKKILSDAMGN